MGNSCIFKSSKNNKSKGFPNFAFSSKKKYVILSDDEVESYSNSLYGNTSVTDSLIGSINDSPYHELVDSGPAVFVNTKTRLIGTYKKNSNLGNDWIVVLNEKFNKKNTDLYFNMHTQTITAKNWGFVDGDFRIFRTNEQITQYT